LIGKEEFAIYYRPQLNKVRGGDTAARLAIRLREAYRTLPLRAFLMGHSGVGKSTELTLT
jgi:putative ribosome biogenesis GTPase RsgA